jgi:two-component system NtrC family sensor kinase
MRSVRTQLTFLFLVAISITLLLSGGYGYYRLSHELNTNFELLQKSTVSRLTASLPVPMWDFNTDASTKLLESEMLMPEIDAIQVFDTSGNLFAGSVREKNGGVTSGAAHGQTGQSIEANIIYRPVGAAGTVAPRDIGRVVVYFSRDRINQLLLENALHSLAEIIVIDALLILVLRLTLRLVFTPLGKLGDALNELASHSTGIAEALPETSINEFSEVVKGYNRIQQKFNLTIDNLRSAEEATRAEANKVESAYESLKAAQEVMVRSEKLASLGGMVAGVAHEINTPVGITLTSASILMEATEKINIEVESGQIKKSAVQEYLTTASESARLILKNAERASQLIYSFKQVASDQTSEERRRYELGEYIDEVMTSLRPKLRSKNVKIKIHCPQPIRLDGYPGAMAQVLTNLTMNSFNHGFVDGQAAEIQISALQVGESVNMTFTDNGAGISPDNIGKVFDLFFTTKRDMGGTGLGLNIVHNILYKKFRGSISVTSEVGKGACFFLNFPCHTS